MACLFCGKELGPIQILRNEEFCCPAHRQRYSQRLGRALNRMAVPEPAPAGMAGFRPQLPAGASNGHRVKLQSGFESAAHPIRTQQDVPFYIPPVYGTSPAPLACRVFSGPDRCAAGSELRRPMEVPLAYPRLPAAALGAKANACEPRQLSLVEAAPPASGPTIVTRTVRRLRLPQLAIGTTGFEEWKDIKPEEKAFEPPPLCEAWMKGLSAEPVMREVLPPAAGCAPYQVRRALPVLPAMALPAPSLLGVDCWMKEPEAEPAVVNVTLRHAAEPLLIEARIPTQLPDLESLRLVEAVLDSPDIVQPAAAPHERQTGTVFHPDVAPQTTVAPPPLSIDPPRIAGLPPGAAKVATMPPPKFVPAATQFAAASIPPAPAAPIPEFKVTEIGRWPDSRFRQSDPRAAAPLPEGSHAAQVKPMQVLPDGPNKLETEGPAVAVPAPGFIAIDFYCQRGASTPSRRLEWMNRETEPMPLPFKMRAAIERFDDPAQKKPAPKPPSKNRLVPDLNRPRGSGITDHLAKIAACLIAAVLLWFGVRAINMSSPTAAVNRASAGTNGANSALASAAHRGRRTPPADKAPDGPIGRLRHAIADRAEVELTDSFHGGMADWTGTAASGLSGWVRNPDGYVSTGDMALYHPSMNFANYRMEFFGQIESKSMGWVVRAQDEQNYYAMKLTVIEPGLRPIIAMSHYTVIGGIKGHFSEMPLNVMVHNRTPLHVAVDVKGDRVTTSIEGQRVDSWTDEMLSAGGVGFFSEAGERARLYWMKVHKNPDWLGGVCAYLSGNAPPQTAELWAPEVPANLPPPADPPRSQEAALASAETEPIGSFDCRRGGISTQRRIRAWSS